MTSINPHNDESGNMFLCGFNSFKKQTMDPRDAGGYTAKRKLPDLSFADSRIYRVRMKKVLCSTFCPYLNFFQYLATRQTLAEHY